MLIICAVQFLFFKTFLSLPTLVHIFKSLLYHCVIVGTAQFQIRQRDLMCFCAPPICFYILLSETFPKPPYRSWWSTTIFNTHTLKLVSILTWYIAFTWRMKKWSPNISSYLFFQAPQRQIFDVFWADFHSKITEYPLKNISCRLMLHC